MKTSEALPYATVAPHELVDLLQHPGPFATVYLTTQPGIENAAQRSEQRFREERGQHDHANDGPPATIAALNEARVGSAAHT